MEITNLCMDSQQSIPSTNIIQAIGNLREDHKVAFKYFCQEQDDSLDDLCKHQNTIKVSLIEHINDVPGKIEQKWPRYWPISEWYMILSLNTFVLMEMQ
eukprot:8333988-Ditylum_brightwellii.AAC.1